jgi:RNA polymerase sigma-70 factor, ECF subfamily
MNTDLTNIIEECKGQNPVAQRWLYEKYKSTLFAICRRYFINEADAEDVFVEGFSKIFEKVNQYHHEGSFEGWMKRIMVNEALMVLRNRKMKFVDIDYHPLDISTNEDIESDLNAHQIMEVVNQLPDGYRTIFNLYVVEGYKHREIAELLNISINTSKSQLIFAKKKMQELLKKNLKFEFTQYGT